VRGGSSESSDRRELQFVKRHPEYNYVFASTYLISIIITPMALNSFLLVSSLSVAALSQALPWVKPDDLNKGLPASVEIYTLNTTNSPFSSKLTGGFVRFDVRDSNLEFDIGYQL
jgi:hypothetical protein